MTPHDRELHKALYEMPLVRRLAFVLSSIVVDDRAAHSVELIIEVALTMAKHLPPSQRTAVCWQLANALSELEAKWN